MLSVFIVKLSRVQATHEIPARLEALSVHGYVCSRFFGPVVCGLDSFCQGNENRRIMMAIEAMGVRDLCSREKKGR
jgi:hypothetical protein